MSTTNMSDITKKDSNILESVAASAAGANIDGRGRNIVFKHKQLTRLFGEYQRTFALRVADVPARLLEGLCNRASGITRRRMPSDDGTLRRGTGARIEANLCRD